MFHLEPSPRVLIVDDEPRNVVALEAALATVDCSLAKASSGREALKYLLTQDVAVIVLDIHMPEMDGFETASLIRARERSASTPIIFLTADDRVGAQVLEGYRLGAIDYLYKPFNADILRSKVTFFVELFRKTAALQQRTAELRTMATELETALAQSQKLRALGQMASGIAHDLNQSLMLVASYGALARQALGEDPPNLAELDNLLATTTQAALDGGESVKRLLLFTRGRREDDSELVELSHLVRDAAQLAAPRWRDAAQAEGRPISLHIEADCHPTIHGSPARLRELLTNLIFNAVDALPTGGTIHLRVGTDADCGTLEVADSGLGMSAEVQRRIFEPFFTTKGEGGTGLGLAMVFGIVEQHGGHIAVRSAPGQGTTFHISFPLVHVSVAVAPSLTLPAQLAPRGPLRILLVDDEPMMTNAVSRMLQPSGHTVSVAASGEEALARLSEHPFDVVISDMGLGAGMNGWELADAVRTRWPRVRFLLATGWGAAIDPGEARTRGVDAVLAKPYRPADLLRVLAGSDQAA
jgi:signal transduction histidine kinase